MKKNFIIMAFMAVTALVMCSACSDDKETSKLPTFKDITFSKTTAAPGETIKATVTFSDPGNYVKGTYVYTTSPAMVAGEFTCASPNTSATFDIKIPEVDENTPEERIYTVTVTPKTMAAYAGSAPYIDPSPMGKVTATFTVLNPTEE